MSQARQKRPHLTLLVNPAAGRGRSAKRFDSAARLLEREGIPFDYRFSRERGHLTELAGALGASLPVVLGGDGSLNEVFNGLPPASRIIGVIPSGTGDDLARNLGIPLDLEGACRTLIHGSTRPVDLVSTGRRLFAGIGGAGVDALVTRRANESRLPLRGRALYIWAVLRTLPAFRPFRFTLEGDGWEYSGPVMFAGVANTPSYGGGLRLSPPSKPDDGILEVCVVGEMSRLSLLACFPRLLSGTHLALPQVRLLSTRRLGMESDRAADFYADGEFLQRLPVELTVQPGALRVVVPDVAGS